MGCRDSGGERGQGGMPDVAALAMVDNGDCLAARHGKWLPPIGTRHQLGPVPAPARTPEAPGGVVINVSRLSQRDVLFASTKTTCLRSYRREHTGPAAKWAAA